jgi:hypothetical protein
MLYDKKWDQKLPQVDEVGRQLINAADYIEKHGWCQNTYWDEQGRVCALGAIRRANALTRDANDAAFKMLRFLDGSVHGWNDAPGRTKEEVVAVLRKVAYL